MSTQPSAAVDTDVSVNDNAAVTRLQQQQPQYSYDALFEAGADNAKGYGDPNAAAGAVNPALDTAVAAAVTAAFAHPSPKPSTRARDNAAAWQQRGGGLALNAGLTSPIGGFSFLNSDNNGVASPGGLTSPYFIRSNLQHFDNNSNNNNLYANSTSNSRSGSSGVHDASHSGGLPSDCEHTAGGESFLYSPAPHQSDHISKNSNGDSGVIRGSSHKSPRTELMHASTDTNTPLKNDRDVDWSNDDAGDAGAGRNCDPALDECPPQSRPQSLLPRPTASPFAAAASAHSHSRAQLQAQAGAHLRSQLCAATGLPQQLVAAPSATKTHVQTQTQDSFAPNVPGSVLAPASGAASVSDAVTASACAPVNDCAPTRETAVSPVASASEADTDINRTASAPATPTPTAMAPASPATAPISSTSASTATATATATARANASANIDNAAAPSPAALAMAQARAAAARVAATAAAAAARVTGTRAGAGNAAADDVATETAPAVAAAAPSVVLEVTAARIAANAHVGVGGLALSWVRNLAPPPSISDLKQRQPMPKLDSPATAAAETATVTASDCERARWGGADELESISSSLNSSLNGICNADEDSNSSQAACLASNESGSGSDISGDKSNETPTHANAAADHSGESAGVADIATDTAGASACNNSHAGADENTHIVAGNVVCTGSDATSNHNHDQDNCGDFDNSSRLFSSISDGDSSTSSENATNESGNNNRSGSSAAVTTAAATKPTITNVAPTQASTPVPMIAVTAPPAARLKPLPSPETVIKSQSKAQSQAPSQSQSRVCVCPSFVPAYLLSPNTPITTQTAAEADSVNARTNAANAVSETVCVVHYSLRLRLRHEAALLLGVNEKLRQRRQRKLRPQQQQL